MFFQNILVQVYPMKMQTYLAYMLGFQGLKLTMGLLREKIR